MILEELKRKLGISQKVICDATSWRPTYLFPNCPRVTNEEKEMLRGFFEESEVLRCLKLCATVKTLGPYGFTMGFFIKCWEILKQDIMLTFQNFHEHERFERSLLCHFLTLILKKEPKS